MFRSNPHWYFCPSTKTTFKEKSILLTMQGQISLWNRTVEQLWVNFLWRKDHISYLPVLFWEVPSRDLPTTWKRRVQTESNWHWKVFIQSFVFTSGEMAPECTRVNKRLAEKIAEKQREPYAAISVSVMTISPKDKAQICPFEEHPCCNTRILRQTNRCLPPPGRHRHRLQFNSQAHGTICKAVVRCQWHDTSYICEIIG